MAPFPQNRSCGRETPCKSSFPLWHGRPVHRLHRRDNENRRGKRGLLSMRPQGHTTPAGELFCSLSMAGSLLHGRPCFCTGLRCGSSGRASAEFSILPPPRHPPAGKKGRYWRFVHLYYTKMRPPCKEKRGKNRCPPSILCSRPPGYTRPPFSSGCTKGRPIGEMPCGGIPHAGMCGVAACSASACARWVW